MVCATRRHLTATLTPLRTRLYAFGHAALIQTDRPLHAAWRRHAEQKTASRREITRRLGSDILRLLGTARWALARHSDLTVGCWRTDAFQVLSSDAPEAQGPHLTEQAASTCTDYLPM
jgi:hypothetical protein